MIVVEGLLCDDQAMINTIQGMEKDGSQTELLTCKRARKSEDQQKLRARTTLLGVYILITIKSRRLRRPVIRAEDGLLPK